MSAIPFNLAIAQMNPIVGDIAGNAEKILAAHAKATADGAELLVTPELSLIGYPPEDLVLMPAFCERAREAAEQLAKKTSGGAALIVGTAWREEDHIYNVALLLDGGKITHIQRKTALPNYGVFDEKRWFTHGDGPKLATWRGHKLGILVCEDMWHADCAVKLAEQGAELLIVINASPFLIGKLAQRKKIAAKAAQASGLKLVYTNLTCGQDEVVFDGGSFVMEKNGEVIAQLPEFSEGTFMVHNNSAATLSDLDARWQAMMLGLKDYVRKNGFSKVVLGLSGGIDSAISAALAVDALGAENVKGVLMPSPYSSKGSVDDALESARLLGIETMTLPIGAQMSVFEEALNPAFKTSGWMENPVVGGNLQARLRGITLMALSNEFGWMVLSTGNKSEVAVGYSTLYGDSCGGYNVLKDIYKTEVYVLANWRNGKGRVIPEASITKAPSAELKPGQLDQDQLPPYELLDAILKHHIEGQLSAQEIIAKGFEKDVVEKIIRLVRISEYKRRQSAPGVKLSPMLLGRERRYPLTNKSDL